MELCEAQLMRVCQPTSKQLQMRLPDAESIHLGLLVSQMAERYPSQDLADSMEGFLWDYEQLALRYSLDEVQGALAEWRITPGARFFPRPDEIASAIVQERERTRYARQIAAQAERRKHEIASFWVWAQDWMQATGNDEAELLRRFPSYKGTQPHGGGMTSV